MSYRLFATRPILVQLGGKRRMVGAGDRLHLSNEDAERILRSPVANHFIVVTSTDVSEAPNYENSRQYEILPEFVEIREAIPTSENPFETPMPNEAKVDNLAAVYKAYATDGEQLLNSLIQNTEASDQPSRPLTEEESKIAEYEKALKAALPVKYNWKSIVAFLDTFDLKAEKEVEFILYIKDKYSGLAPVVAKCNKLLGIEEKEEN